MPSDLYRMAMQVVRGVCMYMIFDGLTLVVLEIVRVRELCHHYNISHKSTHLDHINAGKTRHCLHGD